MILLGVLLGIYGYTLFFLGLTGLLSENMVRLVSLVTFCSSLLFFLPKKITRPLPFSKKFLRKNFLSAILVLLLVSLALVNLVGALGPELAYDALWYHLTLPKIYLAVERLSFIPGGLLYYSVMPQLTELWYAGGLALGGEVYPKIIHFIFGLCTLVLVYKTARLFVSGKLSLFACVVFYANLVVSWESITAYIDLAWTFFSFGSTYLFLLFLQEKKKSLLYLSSLFVGLAISTKLLAFGALLPLLLIICYIKLFMSKKYVIAWNDFLLVIIGAVIVPLPWFLFSFLHTSNPIYPFFTPLYPAVFSIISLENITRFFSSFIFSADPISPLYIISFPLLILYAKRFSRQEKLLLFMGFLSLLLWFVNPKSGGSRFMLPYLPLFSVIVAIMVAHLGKEKNSLLYKTIITAVIFVILVSIGYRGIANSKYIPVLLGNEQKELFLRTNLNFSFGDYYDRNKFFTENIKNDDVVLLIGFHNLYYIDFPYVDQSWVGKGDKFTYIALQNAVLPKRFSAMKKVYEDTRTQTTVFKGEKAWEY